MNKNNIQKTMKMADSQRGAVLFTALVMMVLMTLLAVTMMGNTAIDEKMAQNSQDQNRAFQAAETGIEMAIANSGSLNTSNAFQADGTNTFSQGDTATLGTATTGYGVSVTYTSVFLQKTKVTPNFLTIFPIICSSLRAGIQVKVCNKVYF